MKFLLIPLIAGIFVSACTPGTVLGQRTAQTELEAAGIRAASSGGCTDPRNPKCTSYQGLHCETVNGIKSLKSVSGCSITITGGTESGHPTVDNYPHPSGYRFDLRKDSCLTNYITRHFQRVGNRPKDGRPWWVDTANNYYTDEGNHWDALYTPNTNCRSPWPCP